MIKINEEQLAEVIEYPEDDRSLNIFRKKIRRDFRKIMPKKYGIIPKDPKVYRISKSIAIEMPSWGSHIYRMQLSSFENELKRNFICDVQYFDGKIVFLVKKWKKRV